MTDPNFDKAAYWEKRNAGSRGQGDSAGFITRYTQLGTGSNRTNRRKKVHSTKLPESERPKTHTKTPRKTG